MSRVLLADSGPLYAIIDRSDEHHQRAKQEFDLITNAGLSLTLIVPVVQETHRLLIQRIGLHVAEDRRVPLLADDHRCCTSMSSASRRVHPIVDTLTRVPPFGGDGYAPSEQICVSRLNRR